MYEECTKKSQEVQKKYKKQKRSNIINKNKIIDIKNIPDKNQYIYYRNKDGD